MNGSVGISYQSAAKNPYIFCRDVHNPLPQDNNNYYSYIKDGEEETHTNDAWAYLFAYGTGFGNSSSTYLRDNHMQQVYWKALSTTDWMNSSNKEIQKAAVYATIAKDLAQYNEAKKPTVDIGSNNGEGIIGPIRIKGDYNVEKSTDSYPFAVYNNDSLIGGIEEFYVYYDDNGNKKHPRYKLYYEENGEKKYITGDNTYGNGNFLGKWNVDSNGARDIIELNKANAKGGFYIELQDSSDFSKQIKVKVAYAYLTTEVTFYNIQGKDTIQTSFYWYCEQHKNLPSIVYSGQQYIATGKYRGPVYANPTDLRPYTSSDGKLYKWSYTKTYECINGHRYTTINYTTNGTPICITCGSGIKSTFYIGYADEYKLFSCNDCRTIYSNTSLQELVIIKPSKTEGLGWAESGVTQITYTPIKFKVKKYGPYVNGTSETLLEGAEFQVKATQEGVEIYSATITNNNTIVTIQPHSTSSICVTITETKAPYGYDGIKEPINILYEYSNTRHVWKFQYRPEETKWKTETDLPFGGWVWLEGEDNSWDLPNEFDSKSGDRIRVEQLYPTGSESDGHLIKVYNNPAIELNLEKYNSAGTKNLIGAEFKITVMQDGAVINNGGETVKMESTRLNYKIVPNHTNSAIYVTIEETTAPEGYKKIQEPINIIYLFDKDSATWKLYDIEEVEDEYAEWIESIKNLSTTISALLDGWTRNEKNNPIDYITYKMKMEGKPNVTITAYINRWKNFIKGKYNINYEEWSAILEKQLANLEIWEQDTNSPNDYQSTTGDRISIEKTTEDIGQVTIKVYDEPMKTIKLLKVDDENNPLKGAEFTGEISNVKSFVWEGQTFTSRNGKISFENLSLKTDELGEIVFEDVVLNDESNPIEIKIIELSAPDSGTDEYHYKILSEPVVITMEMTESGGFELVEENEENGIHYNGEEVVTVDMIDQTAQIKIPNEKIYNLDLELLKIDATDSNPLEGATFSGTISNVEETTDSQSLTPNGTNGLKFENIETNEQGKIEFSNLKVIDLNEPIIVEITEIAAPETDDYYYKTLNTPIEIELSYTNNILSTEEEINNVSINGHAITITVPNEKIYNLDLELLKIDADDNNNPLRGATFSGTISNVEETTDSQSLTPNGTNGLKFENIETNEQGKIEFSNLKVKDLDNSIIVTITEISVPDGDNFYYKKLSGEISINIEWTNEGTFELVEIIKGEEDNVTVNIENPKVQITIPNERLINISGKVWLDGQTGIKPADSYDGKYDKVAESNKGVQGVIVDLLDAEGNIVTQFNNTNKETAEATYTTKDDGTYNFVGIDYGGSYQVRFTYDGINYEDTTCYRNAEKEIIGDSKAEEDASTRNTFNDKFYTITNNGATNKSENGSTSLEYSYYYNSETKEGKSTLLTLEADGTAKQKFQMSAYTDIMENCKATTKNINLGLIKRVIDLALSTDVYDAKVSINGQTTNYTYNREDNSLEIGSKPTSDTIAYNLNLYASDYNYRIRDYIANEKFTESNYMNKENPGVKTGDELKVYVIYELNLQNQTTKKAYINEVQYLHDSRYTFKDDLTKQYNQNNNGIAYSKVTELNNVMTIDFGNNNELGGGKTKTLYLVFEASLDTLNDNKNSFENSAEITSYSTSEGLIDVDSQPGNFVNNNQVEDDCDKAGGLTINVITEQQRKISGYVFDENNNKVDDVIVQLIELKEVNGKMYEYIWQETVSGKNTVKKLTDDGKEITTYTNNVTANDNGKYEFQGFIPGDYIVRFIYGDGKTYDLTDNVITYNGQDYKSMADSNYDEEWYNTSSYTAGASVARDNEARRLETMAYSVDVDAKKGLLLKLLDNVKAEDLNETEKETLISTYNELYDPDITEVTDEIITKLLKEKVLLNTWMCAETSKIKVAVDSEEGKETINTTVVNGKKQDYHIFTDINLGLAKRPETKIELKKYITGFKLTASNGQVLVNARVDVKKYLDGTENISDEVQGIKNNVTILGTLWQYEVSPTELNTIVEGAKLEYEYTLVVRNTGDDDNLSDVLMKKYEDSTIGNYETFLGESAKTMKTDMRLATRTKPIGTYLGTAYYTTSNGYTSGNVQTEVTSIRDYLNNDLEFISGKDMNGNPVTAGAQDVSCRVLRDDYSTQDVIIKQTLETSATGKMAPNGNAVLYTVTLGRNPISSTGTISFENYIAEVMSYTNAAGRRATTSTPGNAEIIDAELREGRTHEIDEADTGRIQIGVKTGEDEKTNYILITAIAAGILLIAVGAFVTKKYIIK